LNNQHNTDL